MQEALANGPFILVVITSATFKAKKMWIKVHSDTNLGFLLVGWDLFKTRCFYAHL